MQPFLLAFVDSEFFKLAMSLLLIVAVVVVVVWVLTFFFGIRFVVQSWRQLRSAATRRERIRAAARLAAPFVLIGIWQLGKLVSTHYEATQQADRRAISQHIVDSLRTSSIGIYKLANPTQLHLLATTSKGTQGQQAGHRIADTAYVAEKSAVPFVELVLRADSTFYYSSNLVGDGTGAAQQGTWKVRCGMCFEAPFDFSTHVNDYAPSFFIINPYIGNYESTTTLHASYDKRKLRFTGSCAQQGHPAWFELEKVRSETIPAAP